MKVRVHFYSYFKEIAGCGEVTLEMAEGSNLGQLLIALSGRFPQLAKVERSTLTAVGVEYQDRAYLLKSGDEVSLFPPVQGG